jgi:hypothetical protein
LIAEYFGGVCSIEPVNAGRAVRIASRIGRASDRATPAPSESSESVSIPQRTVKRYAFSPSITNGTVFVASPNAIGRMPDASGSSVPACPAFFARNMRLSAATASVEVCPTALSSAIQPCTSRRSMRGLFIAVRNLSC